MQVPGSQDPIYGYLTRFFEQFIMGAVMAPFTAFACSCHALFRDFSFEFSCIELMGWWKHSESRNKRLAKVYSQTSTLPKCRLNQDLEAQGASDSFGCTRQFFWVITAMFRNFPHVHNNWIYHDLLIQMGKQRSANSYSNS